MRIEINAVRLELTEALKEYIESKIGSVERMIKKFEANGELIAFVEISKTTRHHKQGDIYYAEITMKLPQKTIRLEKTHEDMYGAIDEIKDLFKEEVSKLKEISISKTKNK